MTKLKRPPQRLPVFGSWSICGSHSFCANRLFFSYPFHLNFLFSTLSCIFWSAFFFPDFLPVCLFPIISFSLSRYGPLFSLSITVGPPRPYSFVPRQVSHQYNFVIPRVKTPFPPRCWHPFFLLVLKNTTCRWEGVHFFDGKLYPPRCSWIPRVSYLLCLPSPGFSGRIIPRKRNGRSPLFARVRRFVARLMAPWRPFLSRGRSSSVYSWSLLALLFLHPCFALPLSQSYPALIRRA